MILSLIGSGEMAVGSANWVTWFCRRQCHTLVQAYRLWWQNIYIGKRSNHDSIKPHNIPMTMIGAGLLLFGWYGFNAGSALAINDIALNAFIATNTSICCRSKLDVLRMVDPQEADSARICQRNCSRAQFPSLLVQVSSVRSLPLWSDWSAVSFVSTVSPFWRKNLLMMMRLMHSVATVSAESGVGLRQESSQQVQSTLLSKAAYWTEILDFWLQK